MALVIWPNLKIKTIQWTLDQPAQVNRSTYTGARSVMADPWHGMWSAQLDLVSIVGEANALALRAFLASVRGQINTFRLPATEHGQYNLPPCTVHTTANKGARTIVLSSFIKAGQFFTVNDQLLLCTSMSASGGFCSVNFEPMLRADATAGTAVEVRNPTCLVALTDSKIVWGVNPGQVYSCSLTVEEAF